MSRSICAHNDAEDDCPLCADAQRDRWDEEAARLVAAELDDGNTAVLAIGPVGLGVARLEDIAAMRAAIAAALRGAAEAGRAEERAECSAVADEYAARHVARRIRARGKDPK